MQPIRAAALLIAATLAPVTAGATGDPESMMAFLNSHTPDGRVALTDEVLAMQPMQSMLAASARYFPAESQAMEAAMRQWMLETRDLASVTQMQAGLAAIHAPIDAALTQAADGDLVQMIDDQITLLGAFLAEPYLCNEVITFGYGGMAQGDSHVSEAQLLALFDTRYDAAHRAMAAPAGRGEQTDDDRAAFVQALDAALQPGWDIQLDMLDARDTRLCQTYIDYLTVARDGRFKGADRTRASIVVLERLL